jgi:predicted nucleic acid-binding Zn ribbon protein
MERKTCDKENCERPVLAKGLCGSHYQMARLDRMREEERRGADRHCQDCGEPIPLTKDMRSLYCSKTCKDRAKWKREKAQADRAYENCVQCGAPLSGKNRDARFCSTRCMVDARGDRLRAETLAKKPPCEYCGGPLPLQRQRFCSDLCYVAHRRPETYGLTREQLDELLAQHRVCAVCETDDWGPKGPQVDHDHASGRVRGILCYRCNVGLGFFADDVERLRAAIEYLERAPAP